MHNIFGQGFVYIYIYIIKLILQIFVFNVKKNYFF